MKTILHQDAMTIFAESLQEVMPDKAIREALSDWNVLGRVILVAIGKAAWVMAKAASDVLEKKISHGVVITKYGHSNGPIDRIEIFEGGHPIPDANGVNATMRVLELTKNLKEGDCVLFLVSGGGSALFEAPIEGCSLEYIEAINKKLLSCGADINEINTVRKRLSSVKAGRFALHCLPAKIYQIVLSDVVGDKLDVIASGPAVTDTSTSADVSLILEKFNICIPCKMPPLLKNETPQTINNVETHIIGNVRKLCLAAASAAEKLKYKPFILTSELKGEARRAGEELAVLAQKIKMGNHKYTPPCAIIMGGETIVYIKGSGKGGRNQELALAAAEGIAGLKNVVVFSAGSDGTDGSTDAAGGIVDGLTWKNLNKQGIDPSAELDDNNSYTALEASGGLIKTGPTGTNVNDLTLLLCK